MGDFFQQLSQFGDVIGKGIGVTLILAVVGTIGGFGIGILLSLGRTLRVNQSDNKFIKILKTIVNGICYIYIQVFRGTPMMLQGLIFFLMLNWSEIPAVEIFDGYLLCGCVVIVLNTAAYMGEILRGGILSVEKGQEEGARSLGMSHAQAMFKIIIPQAIKNSIPAMGNEFIVNIKDSSVLNVIGLTELFAVGKIVITTTYNAIGVYVIIGLIYLTLTIIFSLILKIIEKKLNGEVVFNLKFFRHSGSIFGGNN